MFLIVTRRLTMRGFIVLDHVRETKAFLAEVAPLIASAASCAPRNRGRRASRTRRRPFSIMLRGGNVGKMIVKL